MQTAACAKLGQVLQPPTAPSGQRLALPEAERGSLASGLPSLPWPLTPLPPGSRADTANWPGCVVPRLPSLEASISLQTSATRGRETGCLWAALPAHILQSGPARWAAGQPSLPSR